MKKLLSVLAIIFFFSHLSYAQVLFDNGNVFEWAGTYNYMDDDLNVYKLHITGYEGEFSAELEYIDSKPRYTVKCSVTPSEEYKTLEIKFKELKSGKFPELNKMEEIWSHTRNAPVLMELQIDPSTELITTILYELSIKGEPVGKEAIIFDRS